MNNDTFTVNSPASFQAFKKTAEDLIAKHGYVTFTWRFGEKRSLDQNAIFHVWCKEYAAFLLKKDKRQVTDGELEGMKRHAKRTYYAETGHRFMVHWVINPANPEQRKAELTSSRTWKRGEMFSFLTWLQMKAAHDGLVLESKGEYAELQRKQNGEV